MSGTEAILQVKKQDSSSPPSLGSAGPAPAPAYQLRVTLIGIEPPIWRRIQVPSTIPLQILHEVLQVVMGWTDNQLHRFEKDQISWNDCEDDELTECGLQGGGNEMRLADLLKAEGESMSYFYYLVEYWEHAIVVEKIVPPQVADSEPSCLAGERCCPPENVGGVCGYKEFLDVISEPNHKHYKRFINWAGGSFSAEEFDLERVNESLSQVSLLRLR
jgi:hypothetical protein